MPDAPPRLFAAAAARILRGEGFRVEEQRNRLSVRLGLPCGRVIAGAVGYDGAFVPLSTVLGLIEEARRER